MEYVDTDGQAAWIAEHCDLPMRGVALVLDVENEYLVARGIASSPGGYAYRYYDPEEVEHADYVDGEVIARDVERFFGITPEFTRRVLEGELMFLRMRGMI